MDIIANIISTLAVVTGVTLFIAAVAALGTIAYINVTGVDQDD